MYEIYNSETYVNSFHHQSVKEVANGFNVSAKAEDGTTEAIEKDNIVGVQWHPERVNDFCSLSKYIRYELLLNFDCSILIFNILLYSLFRKSRR